MQIYPAIDLKNGQCVRLFQGDFKKATVYSESPLEQAREFVDAGLDFIHVVDLDGALKGESVNATIIKNIKKELPCQIEVGGGIRTLEQIETYVIAGIDRIIIGSKALTDPAFIGLAVKEFGEKIAVGIDARGGLVATDGWLATSKVNYLTLAEKMRDLGVKNIIYTDIAKDGTLKGPSFKDYEQLQQIQGLNIIASGGVSKSSDLQKLAKQGLKAAIVGKAYYQKAISLQEMRAIQDGVN